MPFVSGWDPTIAQQGYSRFTSSGQILFTGPKYQDDPRPLPKAFSLSALLLNTYDQGPVGSCFANMAAYILMIMMAALRATGYSGEVFNPSRRLIWYQCRKLDGSLGSRGDGGSIINSFAAIGGAPQGVGDCKEELWPYRANHNWLEQRPGPDVFQAADKTRLQTIAPCPFDPEGWKRTVYNGNPVGIGIFWPSGWDNACDRYGRTTGIGRGSYGHAVTVIGWVDDWDGHNWYEIVNSHGPIYGTPPSDLASTIPGFKATKFSFWVREDMIADVVRRQWTELYHASGVNGFVMQELDTMLIG